MSAIRVLLADDHPIVRSGVRDLLNKEPDICVVGEAEDGSEALRLAKELLPDVLLLDMELPVMSGQEVARRLQKENVPVCVVALSAHSDRHYIQGLLSTDAAGYLVKDEVPDVIVDAVRGVARGERGWFSRRVSAQLPSLLQSEDPYHGLTERDLEVLKLVVAGKTNLEIAHRLQISAKTVEKHLEGIFTKLKVASRVEAAVYALREEWFS